MGRSTAASVHQSGAALRKMDRVRFHGGFEDASLEVEAAPKGLPKSVPRGIASVVAVPAPAPFAMSAPGPAPFSALDSMDEDTGAQEQGFDGEIVEHDNMKTMTKDFRAEYGPHAEGLHSYDKICELYPDNKWCRLR